MHWCKPDILYWLFSLAIFQYVSGTGEKRNRKKRFRTSGKLTKQGRQKLEFSMNEIAKTSGVKSPEKKELQRTQPDIRPLFFSLGYLISCTG